MARSWYPSGQLRRVAAYGDERARAGAPPSSRRTASSPSCAARTKPALGSDFDDRTACGFAGGPSTVTLYSGKGVARRGCRTSRANAQAERDALGKRRGPRAERGRRDAAASSVRSPPTAPSGASSSGRRSPASGRGRVTVLDQEFHESGKLVRERRWRPTERGAELQSRGELVPERPAQDPQRVQRRRRAHAAPRDRLPRQRQQGLRGQLAGHGRQPQRAATGTQQSFDTEGAAAQRAHLRRARPDQARARARRARQLVRDDEVFEDGSRKAVGR